MIVSAARWLAVRALAAPFFVAGVVADWVYRPWGTRGR